MAEDVVITGRSTAQVAVDMANLIIISIEDKPWKKTNRAEYLRTVWQCVRVLQGHNPGG